MDKEIKKIKLTQGKFAIVDIEDFEYLNINKWFFSSHGYAVTSKIPHRYMHRIILNTPKKMITDHINRNTLDNRKSNLRIADKSLNSINRGIQKNNTSGHKGISWNKQKNKWETYIWKNGNRIRLGFFNLIKDAIFARKKAEKKYHAI